MKPKFYEILQRAVETGVRVGYERAHKHLDTPPQEHIMEAIEHAVMSEICDWFSFDDELGKEPSLK